MAPTLQRIVAPASGDHPADARADALRLLVAAPRGLARAGLRALLERRPGNRVIAEADSAEEAVQLVRAADPGVVVVHGDLPPAGGTEAARRIVAATPAPVVMLLSSDGDDTVFGALRAGATGLLLEDAGPDELLTAVRVVADGDVLLTPSIARRVLADLLARPERLRRTPEQLEELTAREREVVALVAQGLSNEEIAERLVVTRATAKTHVSRALCKLHARDRAQLVVLAYEAGLVRPTRRSVLHSVAA